MTKSALPKKNIFCGEITNHYELKEEIGRGNVGVVYLAVREDVGHKVACKVIPDENLKDDWEVELLKATKLTGRKQVVQYSNHFPALLKGRSYVCILWEYIDGPDLREYVKEHSNTIIIEFVETLMAELLRAFVAMEEMDVEHNDLHEGNIMIAYDAREERPDIPTIKVADFGIGGSQNEMEPKDDYIQFAKVSNNLLSHIDPATLIRRDKIVYENLVDNFLPKNILERDPTQGDFVRNARKLLEIFNGIIGGHQREVPPPSTKLKHPFDYLRCEMMGGSFNLLQSLYSKNFPGYQDLMRKNNTILTGPRGCGKTMIFQNLSLKTQVLSGMGKKDILGQDFAGFYYHCNDLYFAFPYLPKEITDDFRKIVIHYFNLSILFECLDTLEACKNTSTFDFNEDLNMHIQDFLVEHMPNYEIPPNGTDIIRYSLNIVSREKRNVRDAVETGDYKILPKKLLPLDFVNALSSCLNNAIPWMNGKTIFFLLDDYSTPTIAEELQRTLHDFIFLPSTDSNSFFKISTESIVSFFPYNSKGKMMEEGREYVVVDLGDYFLESEPNLTKRFLSEVVDNRLKNTEGIKKEYQNIAKILGPSEYKSYNALARAIRSGRGVKGQHVFYSGWDSIVDLCSGDVAYILDLIKNIIEAVGGPDVLKGEIEIEVPIGKKFQDHAIRELGSNFLNRIEAIPNVGKQLRDIVEAFGFVAHWHLKNKDSKNEDRNPPWQAFRIEVRDPPNLDGREAEKYYQELLRYGIFIRDARGKSQRGHVAPRLYLRKLLIPTFLLTPSKRDNIGLNKGEFVMLLEEPNTFINVKIKIDEEQRRLI